MPNHGLIPISARFSSLSGDQRAFQTGAFRANAMGPSMASELKTTRISRLDLFQASSPVMALVDTAEGDPLTGLHGQWALTVMSGQCQRRFENRSVGDHLVDQTPAAARSALGSVRR